MAIDKAYDDLQEARGRIRLLENRLEQAEKDRDRYAVEVHRLKAIGLGGGIEFSNVRFPKESKP
jgi:hypothetical protein